ncbi:hypothetical protein Micbo1qcDRAFT_168384, partial [Microdochium bolleyi]
MAAKWMRGAANTALRAAKANPVLATVGIGGLTVAAAPSIAVAPTIGVLHLVGFGKGVAGASAASTTHALAGNAV